MHLYLVLYFHWWPAMQYVIWQHTHVLIAYGCQTYFFQCHAFWDVHACFCYIYVYAQSRYLYVFAYIIIVPG